MSDLASRLTRLLLPNSPHVSANDRRNAELTARAVLREIARTHDLVERATLDEAIKLRHHV
jgi:hypothetical protein